MRVTERAQDAVRYAKEEAGRLGHDRVGTEHLLLGLASEGDGVAARVLQELGAGLLELREAVAAQAASGVDPEPFRPDRGPPPWEPPPSASLRGVVPLGQEHPLPAGPGDRLALLSLEVWSEWFDLRYAVVYATPEPEGELPRPHVLGDCQVSDRAGTAYRSRISTSPAYGMVRVTQRTFTPSPPPRTDVLELWFRPPSDRPLSPGEAEAAALLVTTVDLRLA